MMLIGQYVDKIEVLISKKRQRKIYGVCILSCVQLFATPWTVAYQAPLSMGFSR